MSPLNLILILSNPFAGKGRAKKVATIILLNLKETNIPFEFSSSEWPLSLEKYSAVFVIGGDGTLNYFLNKYRDIKIPIAIFKGGSGNDFAWKLYGNLSVAEYLKQVLFCKIRNVDAGICNDRIFINGFGIGFDGAIVQEMGIKKKFSAGHIAYLYTVIKEVLFYKEKEISIRINDSKEIKEMPFLVAVANGERYGGGFRIAPGAILDDQKLNLVLIRKISPFRRILKIPLVQRGKHLSLKIVEHQLVERISIKPSSQIAAHCDGEFIAAASFQISVLPGKYQFFVTE